jgi:hypothetical protein
MVAVPGGSGGLGGGLGGSSGCGGCGCGTGGPGGDGVGGDGEGARGMVVMATVDGGRLPPPSHSHTYRGRTSIGNTGPQTRENWARRQLSLPVARHAKRGLIWVKTALNNCKGLFWAGVATDQAGFGQSG